jgi:hypothetical protein
MSLLGYVEAKPTAIQSSDAEVLELNAVNVSPFSAPYMHNYLSWFD